MQRTNGNGVNGQNPVQERQAPENDPSKLRSRVTNGSALFVEANGCSPWARRFRDLLELFVTDQGGVGNCSEAQCSLIRRVATLQVELERLEGTFATEPATPDQLDLYQRMTNTLRRTLQVLGIERKARGIGSHNHSTHSHRRR